MAPAGESATSTSGSSQNSPREPLRTMSHRLAARCAWRSAGDRVGDAVGAERAAALVSDGYRSLCVARCDFGHRYAGRQSRPITRTNLVEALGRHAAVHASSTMTAGEHAQLPRQ